jgi:hypothetical protein
MELKAETLTLITQVLGKQFHRTLVSNSQWTIKRPNDLTNFLLLGRQTALRFVMTKWNPKWVMKNSFVLILSKVVQPYYTA